ncbi:MAG: hypothetical protein BJ554DRAFT_6619, partial [Olpidium bornovanus]
ACGSAPDYPGDPLKKTELPAPAFASSHVPGNCHIDYQMFLDGLRRKKGLEVFTQDLSVGVSLFQRASGRFAVLYLYGIGFTKLDRPPVFFGVSRRSPAAARLAGAQAGCADPWSSPSVAGARAADRVARSAAVSGGGGDAVHGRGRNSERFEDFRVATRVGLTLPTSLERREQSVLVRSRRSSAWVFLKKKKAATIRDDLNRVLFVDVEWCRSCVR